jgi:NAD-dependent SIR2 family protein deacetylase
MNIFIRTKVGMSAESGLGTFQDKDGPWNSSKETASADALNGLGRGLITSDPDAG